ncbi:MAG: alpha/beta fold hydrolase [Deltaproteobacteria bacterium]|nr:alpha/beta fold hydrolase [Deltaproteobacteria bacterium]
MPASEVKGGRVYRSLFDAGGAQIAIWRWAAAGERAGPPILILPELGLSKAFYEKFAANLQARGREVFLVEWRGAGDSSRPAKGAGGLEALFLGDAPTALRVVLEATKAPRAVLLGHGLGGASAVLVADGMKDKVAGLVLVSVPARYEVPNLAVEKFAGIVQARAVAPGPIALRSWLELPLPFESKSATDLFELLLVHGDAFTSVRKDELRAALGTVAPELVADVWRWMTSGELILRDGPVLPARGLGPALAGLELPVLSIGSVRDNLVHLEHAFALRTAAPKAIQRELVVQRLEGFDSEAGHLMLTDEALIRDLAAQIVTFQEELK